MNFAHAERKRRLKAELRRRVKTADTAASIRAELPGHIKRLGLTGAAAEDLRKAELARADRMAKLEREFAALRREPGLRNKSIRTSLEARRQAPLSLPPRISKATGAQTRVIRRQATKPTLASSVRRALMRVASRASRRRLPMS